MRHKLQRIHHWLISGSDRKLFYRSLLLLMLLVAAIQIGLGTRFWLSYVIAFLLAVAYTYLWLELLKRFGTKKTDQNKTNQETKTDLRKRHQDKNTRDKNSRDHE